MVSNKKFEWFGNWLVPTLGCSGWLVVIEVTGSEYIVRGLIERNNGFFDEPMYQMLLPIWDIDWWCHGEASKEKLDTEFRSVEVQ